MTENKPFAGMSKAELSEYNEALWARHPGRRAFLLDNGLVLVCDDAGQKAAYDAETGAFRHGESSFGLDLAEQIGGSY